MRLLSSMLPAALVLGLAVPPVSAFAETVPSGPDGDFRLAMTLQEMNCAQSDIQLREVEPEPEDSAAAGEAFAQKTNGIPCNKRDPKAPPKKRRS